MLVFISHLIIFRITRNYKTLMNLIGLSESEFELYKTHREKL